MDKMSMEELGFFLYMDQMERQEKQKNEAPNGGTKEPALSGDEGSDEN